MECRGREVGGGEVGGGEVEVGPLDEGRGEALCLAVQQCGGVVLWR